MSGLSSGSGADCSQASAFSKLVRAWVTGILQVSQDFGGHDSEKGEQATYDPGT